MIAQIAAIFVAAKNGPVDGLHIHPLGDGADPQIAGAVLGHRDNPTGANPGSRIGKRSVCYDERLSIDNLVEMIRFYHRLVDQAAR